MSISQNGTIKIKPAHKDILVRDPITRKALDAKGEVKPRSPHWLRRINDGDVIEIKKVTTGGSST